MPADTASAARAAFAAFEAANDAFNVARITGNVAEMDRLAEVAEAAADAYEVATREQRRTEVLSFVVRSAQPSAGPPAWIGAGLVIGSAWI